MLVTFERLKDYRAKVAMVDGCFDPLHRGHIEYFKAASELGAPVLCNITDGEYLLGKHPPLLPGPDRAAIIDAIRFISYTHLSSVSTAQVLRELRPRFYVKGEDWRGRVPEEQMQIAEQYGIEIVLVPTVRDSSTRILNEFLARMQAVNSR